MSNIAGLAVSRQKGGDNGYIPYLNPTQYPNLLEYEQTPTNIDSTKLEYIQRFINMCHNNSIMLVFMVSPMYTKVNADYYDVLKIVAKQNNIPFLDYHTKGLYLDHPDYFHNSTHLWDKGARVYSSVFARDLKRILKQEGII